MAIGRPTKLTPDIVARAYAYIDQAEDTQEIIGDNKPIVVLHVKLPSIEGLANYLNISKETLYQWEKENESFSDVLTRVRNLQAERLINNSLGGSYNPLISRLLLTKHGYVEKSEQDITSKGEKLQAANPTLVDSFVDRLKDDSADKAKSD